MRHQVSGKHLSRTSAHRRALRRNLAASLFEHGTISTTKEKAKFVRPFAEKLITLAKKGTLHARRRVIALLQDRAICVTQDGQTVKTGSVIQKLFAEVAPKFASRPGGYTRIIHLPLRRVGDNGQVVLLQLVSEEMSAKPKKTAKAAAPEKTPATPVESESVEVNAEPAQEQAVEATEDKPAADTDKV
jgi:large subunit ribosomal protein L17